MNDTHHDGTEALLTALASGVPGPPLTTAALASVVGISGSTLRREIALGQVHAHKTTTRPGRRGEWRVHRAEARRYLLQLGVLRQDVHERHDVWTVSTLHAHSGMVQP